MPGSTQDLSDILALLHGTESMRNNTEKGMAECLGDLEKKWQKDIAATGGRERQYQAS